MATEVSANTAVHVSCLSSEWGAAIAYLTALGAINAEGEKRGKRYGFVKKF